MINCAHIKRTKLVLLLGTPLQHFSRAETLQDGLERLGEVEVGRLINPDHVVLRHSKRVHPWRQSFISTWMRRDDFAFLQRFLQRRFATCRKLDDFPFCSWHEMKADVVSIARLRVGERVGGDAVETEIFDGLLSCRVLWKSMIT